MTIETKRGTVTVFISLPTRDVNRQNDYGFLSHDSIWSNVQSAPMDSVEQRLILAPERRQQYMDRQTRKGTAVVVPEFSVDVGDCDGGHRSRVLLYTNEDCREWTARLHDPSHVCA